MGAMIGFVLGYVLGTRAGDEGRRELRGAWQTITSSGEVMDLVSGGLTMVKDLARQGAGFMAERLSAGETNSALGGPQRTAA